LKTAAFFVYNCGQRKTDLVLPEIKAKFGTINRKGHLKVTKVVTLSFLLTDLL
jgi:hypothetical protein